jgi:hypothetical protein
MTVRTFDSYGPDERASKKEIADSTSTVQTTAYHGPDTRIADMEIVLKNSRPNVHSPWSGRSRAL